MKASRIAIAGVVATVLVGGMSWASAQERAPLTPLWTASLHGYSGDFDHFAVDQARGRLLLAAEDHATLEVFNLDTGKHLRTITGFGAPHTILVRPDSPTILVTDSGKSMSKLLDADTYEKKGTIPLIEGADSGGYDAAANIFYVVTGGKDVDMATADLEAINPSTGQLLGKIEFKDNHVEAMALEKNGNRIFINLAQTNKLAVVDRTTMKEIAEWPIAPAEQNAMVAFDEPHHRLFVVCRKPGMVVVVNSDTGEVTNTLPAPLRADELLYDAAASRLYVPGGEGYLGVYDTSDPDHLKEVAKVTTAPGAKTGILLPDKKEIVLAVSPGDTNALAKVLAYSIQ